MGYTGGITPSPTYRNIGNHSESIEIIYDPDIISYPDLLEEFWTGHDPTRHHFRSNQYRSFVFFTGESQKKDAERSLNTIMGDTSGRIVTEIKPAGGFFQAENYHQKYYLQLHRILKEDFMKIYPRMKDFVASTSAARANGFAGGYGSMSEVDDIEAKLGVSERSIEKLKTLLSRTFR